MKRKQLIIRRSVKLVRRRLSIFPRLPISVQIETTNRCNLNCKMCQRRYLHLNYEDMPLDIYKKIIDRIPESVKFIDLTGWGEPTVNPDIFEMVGYAKRKGCKVSFTTNGLLLDSDKREKVIASGLDRITFSIEKIGPNEEIMFGHSYSKQLLENINGLIKVCGKRKTPQITFHTTLHKGKSDTLFELIKYAGKIEIKVVNIIRLDIRFNPELQRPTWQEEREVCRQAQKIGKKFGVVVTSNYSFYRAWRRFSYPAHLCPTVYDYVYINLAGEITPCCGLPKYSMGNILKTPLIKIWQGEKFKKFRKNQERICGKCDVRKNKYSN